MNTKTFFSSQLFKILLVISLVGSLTFQDASGQWLSGWSYRLPVTIDNSAGVVLTDYQVKVSLNSTVWAHVNTDGSDIRFTASDGTTLLSYWIETWDYPTSADVWVKVPYIPAASDATIYLYYGRPGATAASSGDNTFEFFDDFEEGINPEPDPVPYSGWQDLDDIPVPTSDATAAVYNDKLYVFGGYGIGHVDLDIVYEYDPATGNWTNKEPMPSERWGMIAVEFEGLIYVFGGRAGDNNLNVLEIYNPNTDTWSTGENLPEALSFQGLMGVKFGDRIHLFYKSYHYEYDPDTDTYLQKNNVPSGRTWGTCAAVGSHIYIIGGHSGSGTNTNQVLDPVNDSWTTAAPLPVDVYGATRENPVMDGKIYVTHGWDDNYFYVTNYMYDPVTDEWTQRGSAQHARDGVACGVVDGKLYVVGGRNVTSNTYGLPYHEVYDPSSDPWYSDPDPTNKWVTSASTYVYTDESASYSGDFGLVIEQPMDGSTEDFRYAETNAGFGAVYALDYDWHVTTIGGIIESRNTPQAMVRLTETVSWYGNLYFYQNLNPVVRWYTGTMTHLQNSTWDEWHKATIIRNGANSRLIFDNNTYQPLSVQTGGNGRIRFGVLRTTQYIDNVRVRKWTALEPVVSLNEDEENIEWTGAIGSDWTVAGNWNSGFVPEEFNNVVIPDAVNHPIVTGELTINDITIESSARMTVDAGANLTANSITINSSDTQHSGSLVNNGTIVGPIIYNRYLLPKASGGDWQLVSSPVDQNTEDNVDDILMAKEWNEVAGVWNTGTGMVNLTSGHGYNLKQTDTGDGIVTFVGQLVEGDVDVDVTSPFQNSYDGSFDYYLRGYADGTGNSGIVRDDDANWGGGGWNLLGNPFTSAISVEGFIDYNDGTSWETNQFDPSYVALYIHDGASSSYKYVANSTGWVGGEELDQEIQVGQGFFVLAMNDFSTFTFQRSMQVHDVTVPMLKSADSDDRWPGLKLSVKAGSLEKSTLIVYGENMTPGLDPGFDIGQYGNYSELEIYTTLVGQDNGVNFTRQSLPLTDYDKNKVPVGIDFDAGGTVTFSAETVPIGSYKFWLEDCTTGTFTDLTQKSYTATLPANTYGTGRFFIIASTNTPTAVKDIEDEDGLRIWVSNGNAVIKGSVSENAICEVYDMQGKRILERRLSDGELNTIALPRGLKGVYLVRVTDGVKIVSRKVPLL